MKRLILNCWNLWKQILVIVPGLAVSFMVLGAFMNLSVERANKGFMPVVGIECTRYPDAVIDEVHVCAGSRMNHLLWLADRFQIATRIYSLGDIVGMLIGVPMAYGAGALVLLSLPLLLIEKIWRY